jgi:hypothetical protein
VGEVKRKEEAGWEGDYSLVPCTVSKVPSWCKFKYYYKYNKNMYIELF